MNTGTASADATADASTSGRSRQVQRLAILMVLVGCGLWSVARTTGADRIPRLANPLVPVLAFTPYAALLSVLTILWAVALRRWVVCAVTVVVAGSFAVAVVPRCVPDPAPAARGPLLRILSANMHFGQVDPRTLVDRVRRSNVDVLSLQEFTRESAAALDRAGLRTVLPYSVAEPIGGALGSALYARYPLLARPMPDVTVVGQAMPRAEMRIPGGGPVEVMAVHLAKPLSGMGVAQWVQGLAAASAAEPPGTRRILAGDFNGTLDNTRLRRLISAGYVDTADAAGAGWRPTFQRSFWPPLTIDHILVDARYAVRRVAVHTLPRSDHRAVFAEVRLP